MKQEIKKLINEAVKKAHESGDIKSEAIPDFVVEKPRDEKMGDFSSNLAMLLTKSERKKPRDIAEVICRYLKNGGQKIEQVEVAGPGFINLKMSRPFFLDRLVQVVNQGDDYGCTDTGRNAKVMLEFVSANPTGPLHVGHGRGAAVGDTLGRILKKAGYDIHTEYYINDVGNQMNTLGRSTWLRYRELLGETVDFPEDHYQGDYIADIAREIQAQKSNAFAGKSEEDVLPFFRQFASDSVLLGIKQDLKNFRVDFDQWFSEKSLYDNDSVDKAVDWLREKGHVYDKDGAVWLKSSAFQDEKDRVIVKKTGERTYFCSDIAYHQNKIERGFEKLIDIWGADHHGYVPRMKAVLEALGFSKDVFEVLLVQFVGLVRDGEKVSMSTRSGKFITLAEVVEEVGVDATRYFFLMRSSDSHLEFDLELAKQETSENPVFYIQYAHARICNIFVTAKNNELAVPSVAEVDLSLLVEDDELSLIKKILVFPEVVDKSAEALEVHRISYYLHDLVAGFHGYYKRHRVVTDNVPLSLARLFLLDCLRITIRNGLDLMGITAPEKM
jgi:arginyl-tRNA synthetase